MISQRISQQQWGLKVVKKQNKKNKPPSGLVFCADILPSCFTDDISVLDDVQFLSQGNKCAKFSQVNKSHKLFQIFFKVGSSWPLASDFIGCSEWHAAAMANHTPQGCVSPLHTLGKSMLLLFQSVRPAGVPSTRAAWPISWEHFLFVPLWGQIRWSHQKFRKLETIKS